MSNPAPESSNSLTAGLIPFALANLGRPTLVRRASMGIAAWQFGKLAWEAWKRAHATASPEVIVFSNQEIFHFAILWLSRQEIIPERNERSFFVNAHGEGVRPDGIAEPISTGSEPKKPERRIALTPASNVKFRWRGRIVSCQNEKGSSEQSDSWKVDKLTLRIENADEAVLLEMVADIERVGREMTATKKEPWVFYYKWHWQRIRRCTERCAILPEGMLQGLISDIRAFREAKSWYEGVGMPHRRGFLFKGIPGSGKTSAAQAIAAALEMHIYWINLATMTDDDLLQAINGVGENDMLLIEDVDCVSATATRENAPSDGPPAKTSGCTLGGLLNAIDGVATPDGRVLIMTTNHPERLDPALIRPGRIDVQVDFTHATEKQISELAHRFGLDDESDAIAQHWAAEKICMAEVQERLIRRHAARQH
jgi:hypothetical protein